ncbi:MAG TPA: F0F1 ATP synthase subunit beta, partial [Candidatus Kerfeldbacteria bacterium]|nr:F0F1 ATP synthase subunit beta [Candidatus Kerfeldbacteria bacterium]
MPDIFHALEIAMQKDKLILEVQQHLGSGSVRTVAMSSTDGLRRGAKVVNTNKPISVPVGKETLGR